jgi:hypothetical protein
MPRKKIIEIPSSIKPLDEILAAAEKSIEKDTTLQGDGARYRNSYLLGYLKQSYTVLYHEYMNLVQNNNTL